MNTNHQSHVNSSTTIWLIRCLLLSIAIYTLSFNWLELNANAPFLLWRQQFMLLTGITAWVLMTLCMVIAIRPLFLDRWMKGLDKAYAVHKWAGIWALVLSLSHWAGDKSPGWFSALGWINLKAKPEKPPVEGLINWIGLGHDLGYIAIYILMALAIVALVHMIPYGLFQKTHKVFVVLYWMLACHSTLMIPAQWWGTPAPYLQVVLSLIGCWCGWLSLTQKYNKKYRYDAIIESIDQNDMGLVNLNLQMGEHATFSHHAGQFVFVDFGARHGAHPFTLASAQTDKLRFLIKPLGDFTDQITHLVRAGQKVIVEGPYGQFNFKSQQTHQIWVAGGIGVTPFVSRLEHLAEHGGSSETIDFWYCTRTAQENMFPENLDSLCKKANVILRPLVADHNELLTAEIIHQTLNQKGMGLDDVSVWFCGPKGFGKALRHGLKSLGLSEQHFHAENFHFR